MQLLVTSVLLVAQPTICVEAQENKVLVVKLDTEITGATTVMLTDSLKVADSIGARLVVVETNTPGGELNAVKQIMDIFETSPIPICLYVYPMGASAWSGGTYLLVASHVAAMASGTSIGSAQPVLSTGELINDSKHINALTALMTNHARLHDRNTTAARLFVTKNLNLGPDEGLRHRVVEIVADDVHSLLEKLSDKTLIKVESETGASSWKLVPSAEAETYEPELSHPFSGIDRAEVVDFVPGIQIGLLQFLYDPLVSSLMFILGFFFLYVGIQTPGLGAEFVGSLLLLLSLMSMQVIGIEPTVFLLMAVGFVLIVAEVKTNIGFLGLAGAICIVLGSFLMFPSPHWLLAPEVSLKIRDLLVGSSIALCLFFGFLAYKVVQAKRLKVKTGPESVEDSTGVAATALAPYGEVRVGGEFWRARAEEGSIDRGAEVTVVGREGLLLIVRAANPETSTTPRSPSRKR